MGVAQACENSYENQRGRTKHALVVVLKTRDHLDCVVLWGLLGTLLALLAFGSLQPVRTRNSYEVWAFNPDATQDLVVHVVEEQLLGRNHTVVLPPLTAPSTTVSTNSQS
jgi:hypothetical protein